MGLADEQVCMSKKENFGSWGVLGHGVSGMGQIAFVVIFVAYICVSSVISTCGVVVL